MCALFFYYVMKIVPWLRPPLRFALWRLLHILDFGIRPWFCMMVLGVDVSRLMFFRGLGFCGLVGVPEARVWTTFSPLVMCPVSQLHLRHSTSTICHCSQARLGQPRRWRAKQQEIQDSLVYVYSVWCNAACTGPTGAFEANLFQCCL